MNRVAVFVVAFLFCQSLIAGSVCDARLDVLSESKLLALIAPLERGVVVRSSFDQKRVMRLLKKPLQANGSMIYAPQHGLYWQINKPFNYQLIMTSEQFIQISGEQKQIINAADQPAMFAISKIFADLFSGDFLAAERYFSISGQSRGSIKNSDWSLCLRPTHELFTKLISYIEIVGNQKIDLVHIQDVTGDYTEIKFVNVLSNSSLSPSLNNSALSDVEKAYFRKY